MKTDNAQLTAFAAVLSEGTFDLAARKLAVTPSAISQRIKLLEDRLGQVLIRRTTPCQTTSAGSILLRFAEEVALLETEMLAELGVKMGNAPGAVRLPIVVNADSLDTWFGDVFKSVAMDGSITLDVRTEDQDHSVALLREGTVMAGVSASSEPIQGCRVEPLGIMRFLAVASPDFTSNYFAEGVNTKSLNAAPMLMYNRKDALQGVFAARLIEMAISPPTHMIPSTHSFFEAARSGLAWGMMPEQIVGRAIDSGELRQIAPDHWLDVPLYWHRWRIGSKALDSISRMSHEAARKALR